MIKSTYKSKEDLEAEADRYVAHIVGRYGLREYSLDFLKIMTQFIEPKISGTITHCIAIAMVAKQRLGHMLEEQRKLEQGVF